ncbi:hypothetical protein [Desulfosporosinus hippei]|uniref:Uncharacterized protein n=1 Tax=Desulfosporosinus hippei DSM 8344 TaxID=1121419 RepID=A0A1G8CED7_9FIRM|nr:hypothetical protein [Desulfosporosinus hippei]SDH43844.1 hypothetical protein SAMN05443529_11379 [Desulfosporosinus hippei DSM 8344]
MSKRLLVFTAIVVFLGLVGGGYYFSVNKGAETVEQAIEQSGRHVSEMIHQERIKGGIVVFYKHNVGDGYTVNSGYVKEGLFGWKWVSGGGFSGYSGQYFQSISGTPFPMIFGEIKSQGIDQVRLNDKEHKVTKVAKVVGTNINRVWFMFLNKTDGPEFDIVSLSSTGEVLESKSINIISNTNF